MPDLHTLLAAELGRRLEVARAAGGPVGEWHQPDPDRAPGRIEDADGDVVVQDEGAPNWWQAEHIALHDPADAVRRYEAALRVLERHAPIMIRGWSRPVCSLEWAQGDGWPGLNDRCDELLDLAASLGLDTEGSTTDG